MDALVSTEWLERQLEASDLRVVSASKHLPEDGRDAAAEYRAGHIPGALFLDLDGFGGGREPIPVEEDACERLGQIGLSADDRIVIYDDSPYHSAARGWWLLRQYGARHVAILDGGLAKWKAEERRIEDGDGDRLPAASFAGTPHPAMLRTMGDIQGNMETRAAQLIDARSPARFAGTVPEARPGVEPGHIPGARNLPYDTLFHDDGTWKREGTLRAAFEDAGIEVERPVIATCGSGVTAAVLAFGLHLLGRPDAGLYNGSWAEWGADPTTPKARGS